MKNIIILFFMSIAMVTGCSKAIYKKPPVNKPSDDASIKIAEAADSVSESMMEIAKIEKVIMPPQKDNTLTIPNAYNLQVRASVDWSGPIDELTRRIAKAAHFNFRIIGRVPSNPVLVSLRAQDEPLANLLRDIDYQAGKNASIHVYPNTQVVELRYAKLYS